MKAGCAAQKLQFEAYGKRDVVAYFDGGRMTSDGGGLLLREANCCLGDLMARLGQCVSDFRQQGSVEHTATDLIAQRVFALVLGYEDLNDHGTLRRDSLLALLAGRKDLTGQGRKRKRRRRSGWTWTRSTTQRTASRKAVSIMATTGSTAVVFRIILHDDFRIISDANLVIIQIVSCRRELGARGLTEAAGSGKFPSGGTDDSDLFCFAADLQLNRGLDGSAVGWQGVVRSGTVFCRSRLRGLAGPVGSGVGIAVAGRSSL